MPITLRNQKGSALTYTELDDNFLFLSTSYVQSSLTSSMTVLSSSFSVSSSRAATSSFAVSSSVAISSSFAVSASWSPSSAAFPFTGDAQITGSLLISGSPGEGIRVIPESGNSAFFAYDSYIIARDFTNNNRAYIAAEDSTSTKNATIAYHTAFGPYVALKDGTYNGIITTGSNWSSTYFYRLPAMSGEIAVFPYTGSAQISGSLTLTGSIRISGSLVMNQSASFVAPITASSNPPAGAFYFDFNTVPNKLYAWNGVQWVTASLG